MSQEDPKPSTFLADVSHLANITVAICAVLSVWFLYQQGPHYLGNRPSLAYFTKESNSLTTDQKTGLMRGETTVGVRNMSPTNTAQDVYVVFTPVDASTVSIECNFHIEEQKSVGGSRILLVKSVPPQAVVEITLSQQVKEFPKWLSFRGVMSDEPGAPHKYHYRYTPKVVHVYTEYGDARHLDHESSEDLKRYPDDADPLTNWEGAMG